MGALVKIRKRIDDYLNPKFSQSPEFHISKRPRFSPVRPNPNPTRPKSVVERLSRYPKVQTPLPRVHAPCRPQKFLPGDETMGNMFYRIPIDAQQRYMEAKREALASFGGPKRDNVVIELDSEEEEENVKEELVVVVELEKGKVECTPEPSGDLATLAMENGNVKMDRAEKLLGSLTLENEDGAGLKGYKKLLESVEKRTPRLDQLGFQIQYNKLRLAELESQRPKKKPVEVVPPKEPFIPLKKEDEALVQRAFSNANRRKVLVTHASSNIDITVEQLQCLRPGAWLNDEVINVYLELLKEREKRDPQKFLKCHFFNTFFYKKLIGGKSGYDYKPVRRWTTQKKLGYSLIDCEKIFVPIHREIHWCLAVINKKDQKFQYLDSLKGWDTQVMKALAKYYVDEVKDKTGKDIDVMSWKFECVEDLPEQKNGFDCGVFMIKYADFYSRGLDLCFHQKDMPYFRLRTAKEVLQLRAD